VARTEDVKPGGVTGVKGVEVKGPEFLALNQLHALTHLIQFYYGATWNTSAKAFFSWRDDVVAAGDFESCVRALLLLDGFSAF
jgi:hypothetical protein